MTEMRAFIGVSLDSAYFSRTWVRYALETLSPRYERLMILLADDVLKFTRSPILRDESVIVDFDAAASYSLKRREEVRRFFESEVLRLPAKERASVCIHQWSEYADSDFNEIHRKLRIAYETLTEFRSAIDTVAIAHGERQTSTGLPISSLARLNACYIVEESAMCMRVTEREGYSDEYHPSADLPVLPALYAGAFASFGLTPESVTGSQSRRCFRVLLVP